jgi:endonuclease/exonuclease/phosphatase family metal-dependent hydrolase
MADKPGKRKLSLFNKVMMVISSLVSTALLFSLVCSYISPLEFWPAWFMATGFSVLVGAEIIVLLYWLVIMRWPLLIPVVTLAICLVHINRLAQFRMPLSEAEERATQGINVMSYNVHLFDWYNWRNPWEKRNKILDQIKDAKPDIICFQEFFNSPKDKFITLDSIIAQNGLKYFHFEKYVLKKPFNGYGMMIFSRWPIVNRGRFEFDGTRGNAATFADVLIKEDTIRIYNLHLESNRLKPEDYEFINDVGKGNSELKKDGWRNLARRLKNAATVRASEADTVASHIAQSPHPVIVCGDFNDSPTSYTYNHLSTGLKDAFLQKGVGIGQTYVGTAPSFRIDFILHHPGFQTTWFETHPEELSDHHAISARIKLDKEKE